MAVTRAMLNGMGLTEAQASAIIDAHTETLDSLKKERDRYKADADKLSEVQKQLDDLKAGTVAKADYDKLKNEFDGYKADVAGRETLGKVKAAYRALLEGKKIAKEDADLIMAGTKFDGMKLKEDGTLEGAEDLGKTIDTQYARYIPTEDKKGADVDHPPKPDKGDGANPLAAQIAKRFHEQRYGKAPDDGGAGDKKE